MTEFDPSDVPPREDFDAEPDLAELLLKARELARALPERARADPGAPFEPESLDAAALMYRHDRPRSSGCGRHSAAMSTSGTGKPK